MKNSLEKPEHLKQYLLCALDEDERQQLEEQLLADPQLLEELSAAENDVVYDHLSGVLSAQEEERFRTHFLSSPQRHQKLSFFTALKKNIDARRQAGEGSRPRSWGHLVADFVRGRNPFVRVSYAAAVVLAACVGLWGMFHYLRGGGPGISDTRRPAILSVTLTPDGMRGADGDDETPRVVVRPGAEGTVKFYLVLPADNHRRYHAEVFAEQGAGKAEYDNLEVETVGGTKAVVLPVPSNVLTRGDYRIKLSARTPGEDSEEVDSYSFRLVRN